MDFALLGIYGLYVFGLFTVIFWLMVYYEFGIREEKNPPLKKFLKVSIVVPAWNEEDTIVKTLKSIIGLDYPKKKLEVIVVNDGSTDNTRNVVEEFIAKNSKFNIILINQKNSGKAVGMNNALGVATGEIFVCLDADSFIAEDALMNILPYFEKNPDVGVVMPLMRVVKPKTFIQKIQWCEYIINYVYKSLMSKLDMVHVAPGPFSVYRKHILTDVGGFDENTLTEDLEMTLKIQKGNYKVVQMGNSSVYTNTPQTLKAFYKQRNRWYKGSIGSIIKHKDLIFNKKYGDFGFFQAPFILINGFIALFSGSLIIYRLLLKPLYTFLGKLASINFDPNLLFYKFNWNFFSLMGLDYLSMFMAGIIIILAIFILALAMKHTSERFFKYGFLVLPVYLFLYGFILWVIWLGVFFDLMRGKVQKW